MLPEYLVYFTIVARVVSSVNGPVSFVYTVTGTSTTGPNSTVHVSLTLDCDRIGCRLSSATKIISNGGTESEN